MHPEVDTTSWNQIGEGRVKGSFETNHLLDKRRSVSAAKTENARFFIGSLLSYCLPVYSQWLLIYFRLLTFGQEVTYLAVVSNLANHYILLCATPIKPAIAMTGPILLRTGHP